MKNRKKIVIVAFVLIIISQLLVVMGLIGRFEFILATGKQFKFRTAPVDPYDAFRGRYVALDIKEDKVECNDYNDFDRGERVYAIIEVDKDGFAKFAKIQHEKPKDGIDYLRVKLGYAYSENVSLEIPFDRFYMEENEAQKAEDAYRDNNRKDNTYITVKIKYGYGVTQNLFIDNIPVREYIAEK